jgi:hypothetical protein
MQGTKSFFFKKKNYFYNNALKKRENSNLIPGFFHDFKLTIHLLSGLMLHSKDNWYLLDWAETNFLQINLEKIYVYVINLPYYRAILSTT